MGQHWLMVVILCGAAVRLLGQTPVPEVAANLSTANSASEPGALPSVTMQPAVDALKQTMSDLTVNRWKASPVIKNEAETNVKSIERDLESTLPGLLAVGDAAPISTAKVLPVYRNAEALYDVLLRLVAAGRMAAPAPQEAALDGALAKLDIARRALVEQLQANAEAQEKRVDDLQAALKAIPPPAPVAAAAPVTCPAVPVKKKAKVAAAPSH